MTETAAPDLREFHELSKPRKPPCRVRIAAEQLKPKERKELDAACDADREIISSSAVSQWLERRGHEVSPNAVAVHRQGRCRCGK